jgi:hypothetical protein
MLLGLRLIRVWKRSKRRFEEMRAMIHSSIHDFICLIYVSALNEKFPSLECWKCISAVCGFMLGTFLEQSQQQRKSERTWWKFSCNLCSWLIGNECKVKWWSSLAIRECHKTTERVRLTKVLRGNATEPFHLSQSAIQPIASFPSFWFIFMCHN